MILVTLGTQDKNFVRLLEKIDQLINNGLIKDKVIVQAGFTKYNSENMEIFDLIPQDEFNDLMNKADIIITHGGVGNIISALEKNKKVIAVPRLAKYGEHINDHQTQIIAKFNALGYIIGLQDVDELDDAVKQIKKFKPKKFVHDNSKMLNLVSELIDK
ncbi:MAG: PssE/Cps14G family polysaccharide biosynthesis glycosyltransferase [Bacilli bacterium]|nr:PssE/Cps14G family polysaccharide biosynthesis glycosyltransferase [Bacilli bacterium]